jgi:pimeloyl-ACP methyl ester carboxylesterase
MARALDALKEPLFGVRAVRDIAGNIVRHGPSLLAQVRIAGRLTHLPASSRIHVPTLVAWGRRDGTMPRKPAVRASRAASRRPSSSSAQAGTIGS